MQGTSLVQFSNTRLPADHFLSGALLAGITTLASDYDKGLGGVQLSKNVLKNSLSAGIATAATIKTANSIVNKEYQKAAISAALGVAGVILTNTIIK